MIFWAQGSKNLDWTNQTSFFGMSLYCTPYTNMRQSESALLAKNEDIQGIWFWFYIAVED